MTKTTRKVLLAILLTVIAGFVGSLAMNLKAVCIGCTLSMAGICVVYTVFQEFDFARVTGLLGLTAMLFACTI